MANKSKSSKKSSQKVIKKAAKPPRSPKPQRPSKKKLHQNEKGISKSIYEYKKSPLLITKLEQAKPPRTALSLDPRFGTLKHNQGSQKSKTTTQNSKKTKSKKD